MATPPLPAQYTRFTWHCDVCNGDSIFDIVPQGHPSANQMACLGCGHAMPAYLDNGVQHRYFRAQGPNAWQPVD